MRPDGHEDKDNLRLAKELTDEVARSVNEDEKSSWRADEEGTQNRNHRLRQYQPYEEPAECQVEEWQRGGFAGGGHGETPSVFVNAFCQSCHYPGGVRTGVCVWRRSSGCLRTRGPTPSMAFGGIADTLLPICTDVEKILNDKLLLELARLIAMTESDVWGANTWACRLDFDSVGLAELRLWNQTWGQTFVWETKHGSGLMEHRKALSGIVAYERACQR